ncbi:MAG: zinc-dependent peptidase [Betaproteobacteria bacterium]|nr:zinc-dependent peptidase [Betaproteobacteria bacterium]
MGLLTSLRRRSILRRASLSPSAWAGATDFPLFAGLSHPEHARLREWVVLFLHDKQISPAAGMELSEAQRLVIAAQACLPILALDLGYYGDFVEVIVYPGDFIPRREYRDEAGVVHEVETPLAGESWTRGPLILSWDAVERSREGRGSVVIHEFAHKLDLRNGRIDGVPPLHPGMAIEQWAHAFSQAYGALDAQISRGEEPAIDPYGAQNPAEFFAVASEAFFSRPHALRAAFPAVYGQLSLFYRQDPARRRPE